MTRSVLREYLRNLAPAAAAFEQAKRDGLIRVSESGHWQECITGMTPPPKVENPDQLELI